MHDNSSNSSFRQLQASIESTESQHIPVTVAQQSMIRDVVDNQSSNVIGELQDNAMSEPHASKGILTEPTPSQLLTRFNVEFSKLVSSINCAFSLDLMTQLKQSSASGSLEAVIAVHRYKLENDLKLFASDMSAVFPGAIDQAVDVEPFNVTLPNWSFDFDKWSKTSNATYPAPDDKECGLLCFPKTANSDPDAVRYWLTSGRSLIEVDYETCCTVGGIYVPPEQVSRRHTGDALKRYKPPVKRVNLQNIDLPISMTLRQIEDIFRFVYKLHIPIRAFKKLLCKGVGDRSQYSLKLPSNTMGNDDEAVDGNKMHPFLSGTLLLAFQEFFRCYQSNRPAYLMTEQVRRLLINLVFETGRNRDWQTVLSYANLISIEPTDQPDAITVQLKAHLKHYYDFLQPTFERTVATRSKTGQRVTSRIKEHVESRRSLKAQRRATLWRESSLQGKRTISAKLLDQNKRQKFVHSKLQPKAQYTAMKPIPSSVPPLTSVQPTASNDATIETTQDRLSDIPIPSGNPPNPYQHQMNQQLSNMLVPSWQFPQYFGMQMPQNFQNYYCNCALFPYAHYRH